MELDYHGKSLTELPKLPDDLKVLSCFGNRLTQLPKLPNGLQKLMCTCNQIKRLPKLPDGLQILYCYNNKIKRLSFFFKIKKVSVFSSVNSEKMYYNYSIFLFKNHCNMLRAFKNCQVSKYLHGRLFIVV